MLLSFSFRNFQSFADRAEVSFVLDQRDTVHGWDRLSPSGERLSTAMAVMGANGAGKTSVLQACTFLAWFLKASFDLPPAAALPLHPHMAHPSVGGGRGASQRRPLRAALARRNIRAKPLGDAMAPLDLARSLDLPKRAVALVLAGGRGSRLKALTDTRAKPAVYFGGKFRIVDFALSNCLNSGIRRIGVITQYKSHSLLRHLQRGWAFLKVEMNEFVDLLPAQQRIDEEPGTAAPPMRWRRTRTSSTATAPTMSSCWPATTSTR